LFQSPDQQPAMEDTTESPLPRRRWDLEWVVAVTRSGSRVIYACVPCIDSAITLRECAVERGYRDATVERLDNYMRKHGSKSAREYMAAIDAELMRREESRCPAQETIQSEQSRDQQCSCRQTNLASREKRQQRGYRR
jgi:hypothetical protein